MDCQTITRQKGGRDCFGKLFNSVKKHLSAYNLLVSSQRIMQKILLGWGSLGQNQILLIPIFTLDSKSWGF